MFNHVERERNLVNVGRDSNHVDEAFGLLGEVGFVVALFGVRHDGDFDVALVVADYALD